MSHVLSLLSLNCFALWLPGTGSRLLALAQELEQRPYDLVCLQEFQLHKYVNLLSNHCPSYGYSASERYFHCPKGGLLTLSRLPLARTSFEAYRERGLWHTPMLLDRLFYKGMLIARLTWAGFPVVILNTHLLANYIGDWERHGRYARVEEKQLWQLARTVRAQPGDALILVMGDFNIPRGSRLYHDFLEHSGLRDSLADDPRPTLRTPAGIPFHAALAIDYIFFRIPNGHKIEVQADLAFTSKRNLSEQRYGYLSDHYGIQVRVTMEEHG